MVMRLAWHGQISIHHWSTTVRFFRKMAPTAHKESTGLNLQQNPITLGCVPEHFSGPLYLSPSPSVNIKSCPGGTGQVNFF